MMKAARTTNVWTGKSVSVEAERNAVVSDPRATPYFGKPQERRFPWGVAKYWQQPRHTATAHNLDTGEDLELVGSSAQALHEQIAHYRDGLLTKYQQAQVHRGVRSACTGRQAYSPGHGWPSCPEHL